jgi:hypothetical protein
MDLILLSKAEHASQYAEAGAACAFVCLDSEAQNELHGQGKEAVLFDSCMSGKLAQAADIFAFKLSKSWRESGGADFTTYKGISLGLAHEWKFLWENEIPKLKFLVAMKGLVGKHKPKRVVIGAGLEKWRWQIMQRMAGRDKAWPKVEMTGEGEGGETRIFDTTMKGWEPHKHDRAKRFIRSTYGIAAGALASMKNRPRVLIGPYFSGANVYREWAGGKKNVQLVFREPSNAMGSILTSIPQVLEIGDAGPADASLLEAIEKRWEIIRRQPAYRRKFVFDGTDMADIFAEDIGSIIRKQFYGYAKCAEDYRQALERGKIRAIVLPYDAPPEESILLQLAESMGIPSALIIHGILHGDWFNDSYYTHADEVMVWGEWQARTYRALGKRDGFGVVSTGNPKFDTVYCRKKAGRKNGGKPRVLVLADVKNMSMAWARSDDPERFLHGLLGELKELDVRVVVKPHPASNMDYYRGQIARYPNAALEADKQKDIVDCIQDADVVIAPYSTALLESLLLKPTIYYNIAEFIHQTDATRRLVKDGLKEYRDPKSVRRAVEDIIAGRPGAERGHTLTQKQLEFYCGVVDGQSSRRVLDEIERLAGAGEKGAALAPRAGAGKKKSGESS